MAAPALLLIGCRYDKAVPSKTASRSLLSRRRQVVFDLLGSRSGDASVAQGLDQRTLGAMIALPAGAKVWLAAGATDMRKGFDGLSALLQMQLAEDPFSGQLFVFRGGGSSRPA